MAPSRPIAALRGLFAGGRLVLCTAVATVAFALLPSALRLSERLAAAWVLGAGLFLGLTWLAVGRASADEARRRARQLDARRSAILAIIVAAAAASLLALGFTLRRPPNEATLGMALRLVLAGLTVLASWMLTHVTFALHYAHSYYGDAAGREAADRGGLAFPGGAMPDYWDFLYFSFVVGMTCQVSDVQVTSREMRRLTLVHGIVAFFFNTVILALAVNLLAGAL